MSRYGVLSILLPAVLWAASASAAPVLRTEPALAGPWRLSVDGRAVCDLTLAADGRVTPSADCRPDWAGRRLAFWDLRYGRLTLFDADHRRLTRLVRTDETHFVAHALGGRVETLSSRS